MATTSTHQEMLTAVFCTLSDSGYLKKRKKMNVHRMVKNLGHTVETDAVDGLCGLNVKPHRLKFIMNEDISKRRSSFGAVVFLGRFLFNPMPVSGKNKHYLFEGSYFTKDSDAVHFAYHVLLGRLITPDQAKKVLLLDKTSRQLVRVCLRLSKRSGVPEKSIIKSLVYIASQPSTVRSLMS